MTYPEWYDFPEDPIRSDFRNFLFLVWQHLGLPDPTPGQYEIAYFLQHGYPGYAELPDGRIVKRFDAEWDAVPAELRAAARALDVARETGRSDIIEGFRGVGKSYISAAFSLWLLLRDPVDEKILVVSASSVKAREFVAQCKAILMSMELLAHLRPRVDQRDQADRFDVNGASISQSPSLKAAGITGQITGSRARHIIPDDIEVPDNSRTEESRAYLLKLVNEFDAILTPGPDSGVFFLGTPQTEESIYNRLIRERGFNCFCFPARFPRADKRDSYKLQRETGEQVDILAPCLRAVDAFPDLAWKPTDPKRFGEVELASREAKGRSFFMLQYMLDTTLSDAERYPLKQFDLIVMSCNALKAPATIQWGRDSDKRNVLEIPNVGFSGDYFLGPLFIDSEWRPYTASVLFVDPSGRGKDETAWAIVKELHGVLYALRVDGVAGDINTSMERIARDAKLFNVNEIIVEPNYGGVMWINAFQPVLARIAGTAVSNTNSRLEVKAGSWSCSVYEAEWSKGMKEGRIIDTLEPVMNQHRMVVDESVARDETLMYQMTHIAKERGCLTHDDRIDALAGAVNRLANAMMLDMSQADAARKEEELMAELEDFVETCTITSARGMRRGRSRRDKQNTVHEWRGE